MARNVLLIVHNGLSLVFVGALTLLVQAVGQKGVTFSQHRTIFPTLTCVNTASIAIDCLPDSHGLVENTWYIDYATRL